MSYRAQQMSYRAPMCSGTQLCTRLTQVPSRSISVRRGSLRTEIFSTARQKWKRATGGGVRRDRRKPGSSESLCPSSIPSHWLLSTPRVRPSARWNRPDRAHGLRPSDCVCRERESELAGEKERASERVAPASFLSFFLFVRSFACGLSVRVRVAACVIHRTHTHTPTMND